LELVEKVKKEVKRAATNPAAPNQLLLQRLISIPNCNFSHAGCFCDVLLRFFSLFWRQAMYKAAAAKPLGLPAAACVFERRAVFVSLHLVSC